MQPKAPGAYVHHQHVLVNSAAVAASSTRPVDSGEMGVLGEAGLLFPGKLPEGAARGSQIGPHVCWGLLFLSELLLLWQSPEFELQVLLCHT